VIKHKGMHTGCPILNNALRFIENYGRFKDSDSNTEDCNF